MTRSIRLSVPLLLRPHLQRLEVGSPAWLRGHYLNERRHVTIVAQGRGVRNGSRSAERVKPGSDRHVRILSAYATKMRRSLVLARWVTAYGPASEGLRPLAPENGCPMGTKDPGDRRDRHPKPTKPSSATLRSATDDGSGAATSKNELG
jgi:hypothetical protein